MIRRHLRFSSVKQRGQLKNWQGKMKDVPCFILGNGPSLNDEDISDLSSYFTIGINRSFLKLDSTVLLWQDIELWYTERKNIVKLAAIKVCRQQSDPQNRFFHFRLEMGAFKETNNPSLLYGSGSTGPLAVQFACALGCNPLIILGMDCKPRGSATDFYGKNRHHKPHTMKNCMTGLRWIRESTLDREIFNCSENDLWPRISLVEAKKYIDAKKWKKDRSYYAGLLTK